MWFRESVTEADSGGVALSAGTAPGRLSGVLVGIPRRGVGPPAAASGCLCIGEASGHCTSRWMVYRAPEEALSPRGEALGGVRVSEASVEASGPRGEALGRVKPHLWHSFGDCNSVLKFFSACVPVTDRVAQSPMFKGGALPPCRASPFVGHASPPAAGRDSPARRLHTTFDLGADFCERQALQRR